MYFSDMEADIVDLCVPETKKLGRGQKNLEEKLIFFLIAIFFLLKGYWYFVYNRMYRIEIDRTRYFPCT